MVALLPDYSELQDAVAAAPAVSPVGGRTHWEVGGPPPAGAVEVSAPSGVVTFDPDDLTVTVNAGTPYAELAAVLAEHGQECALDPRDPAATVGGVLATGACVGARFATACSRCASSPPTAGSSRAAVPR